MTTFGGSTVGVLGKGISIGALLVLGLAALWMPLVVAIEIAAVLAMLLGAAAVFGPSRTRRLGTAFEAPGTATPDLSTSALTSATLGSLDRIEHRRVELGSPWPQLLVGPTGAAVVEVCVVDGPVEVTAEGVRDLSSGSCVRCFQARRIARAVREVLDSSGQEDVPVRVVGVAPSGTGVSVDMGAPADLVIVTPERLADVLARGPVLPMTTVDTCFSLLAGTVTGDRGLVQS